MLYVFWGNESSWYVLFLLVVVFWLSLVLGLLVKIVILINGLFFLFVIVFLIELKVD